MPGRSADITGVSCDTVTPVCGDCGTGAGKQPSLGADHGVVPVWTGHSESTERLATWRTRRRFVPSNGEYRVKRCRTILSVWGNPGRNRSKNDQFPLCNQIKMVRAKGLEPPRLAAAGPKPAASTISPRPHICLIRCLLAGVNQTAAARMPRSVLQRRINRRKRYR